MIRQFGCRPCTHPALASMLALLLCHVVLIRAAYADEAVSAQAVYTDETASAQAAWISAIGNDRADTLARLLDEHSPDLLLPLTATNGKTALMVAAKLGDKAFARSLVAAGSDINSRTVTGGTAFMFAILGDDLELARWFKTLGADVHVQGTNGWTAVTIASAKGFTETLEWLLEIGADGRVPDVYRFTPLMRAVDNNHLSAARLLIEKAQANVNAVDEYDNTPLHHAVSVSLETGQSGMVELLLDAGASALSKNREGVTPLAIASKSEALSSLLTNATPK